MVKLNASRYDLTGVMGFRRSEWEKTVNTPLSITPALQGPEMHFADAKSRHWPRQERDLYVGERSEPIVVMQVLAGDWSRQRTPWQRLNFPW
jgi:hypothetical protein